MSSETNKKISVILPAYNSEKYLGIAIKSILNQSFSNFELIIIDDGSTDNTSFVIKSFIDPRIIYIKNEKNLGLSKSFNIGINRSTGEYIARMDADDISVLDRFQKQIGFLEKNPDIGIVGTAVTLIDENAKKTGSSSKASANTLIKWSSLFSTPMHHPTVMGRAEIFRNNLYDENLLNSEDYELWGRLLFDKQIKFANLKEPLLLYRVYRNSFTQKLGTEKKKNSALNSIKNIERYIKLEEKEKNTIVSIRQQNKVSAGDLLTAFHMYKKTARVFIISEHINQQEKNKINLQILKYSLFLIKYKFKSLFF